MPIYINTQLHTPNSSTAAILTKFLKEPYPQHPHQYHWLYTASTLVGHKKAEEEDILIN